jgi:type 1 glutamine amidotransferase
MKVNKFICLVLILFSCANEQQENALKEEPPSIVFVIGDEEYRSEESMPMLASILERELNADVTLCFSVDSAGFIDPNRLDHIEGLEALEDADLMVMFTRFRELPKDEVQYILDYAESGRPMVGFRTSTHAFLFKNDSNFTYLNNEWPTRVFGQQWITHHGHFDDGANPLTEVSPIDSVQSNILNGVGPFKAYSWLYHVDGGDWELYGDSRPILMGTSLRSGHEEAGRLDQYPLTNPVAWTKSYTGSAGASARVFFTTLGHPYDFNEESMRKLALNGIYWALDKEIPRDGVNAVFATHYDPSNSGFGEVYKKGIRPSDYLP